MAKGSPAPRRVVAHTCSNTEIVCALGMGHLLVGVDSDSDYPGELIAPLPKLGRDLNLDIAAVLALKPDLVLSSATLPGHHAIVEQLRATGLPVLVCGPLRLADVYEDIARIAAALGVPERGAALVAHMRDAMPPVNRPEPRPRVLVEWWPKPVYSPGQQSWVTDVIALAGGDNPFAQQPTQSLAVSEALLRSAAPNIVVMSWCGVPVHNYRPDIVLRRPGWAGVPAVKSGQVHAISEAYLGRPGPRLVQGYAALRALIAAV